MSEIHDAVQNGDVERVRRCLDGGADVNDREDTYGRTPLHVAAREGREDLVRLLLAAGAYVNARGDTGETPLLMAADSPYALGAVRLLVGAGARVNEGNAVGMTALHLAARFGDIDVVMFLLESGADVTIEGPRGTALDWVREGLRSEPEGSREYERLRATIVLLESLRQPTPTQDSTAATAPAPAPEDEKEVRAELGLALLLKELDEQAQFAWDHLDVLVREIAFSDNQYGYEWLAKRLADLMRRSLEAYGKRDAATYDGLVAEIQAVARAFERAVGSSADDLLRKLAGMVNQFRGERCGTAEPIKQLEMHWQGIGGWR